MYQNWNTNLQEAPINKFIELKCTYMFITFIIIATIEIDNKHNLIRGNVIKELKGSELEEMFYRSSIDAWRYINE